MLSQADREHLHETAFDRTPKECVRFDPVDDDGCVGLVGQPIRVDGHARWRRSQLDNLQGRSHGRPYGLVGYAEARKHVRLALGSGTSVAAHCRDYERVASKLSETLYDSLDDAVDSRDSPAAHPDGDALPRADSQRYLGSGKLPLDRMLDGDWLGPREALSSFRDPGKGRAFHE